MLKRVRTVAQLKEGYVVESRVRKHRIIMDLPPPLGKDEGPTPVDIMLMALAGCIAIVARHHAKNFNIEIKSLKVIVEGEYDTAGFEGKDVKPGLIETKIIVEIESPNSEEELKKFFEFVEKHCPVGDTYADRTPIKLEIKKL